MNQPTCPRDDQPIHDNGTICGVCAGDLRDALLGLAEHLPELATTAAMQTAGANRATTRRTGRGDGISVHALDVHDEVRAVITPWVRMLLDEGVIATVPERLDSGFADTAALCRHLADRMSLIRQAEIAPDLAGDVLDDGQSLCIGNNDPDVPDEAPHYPPGEFVPARRPALLPLVRQVIDTHRAQSVTAAAGDRLEEAMGRHIAVDLAVQLVREQGVAVTDRQVRRWIGEQRMTIERDEAGDPLIMPWSLVELAGTVRRGRRAA